MTPRSPCARRCNKGRFWIALAPCRANRMHERCRVGIGLATPGDVIRVSYYSFRVQMIRRSLPCGDSRKLRKYPIAQVAEQIELDTRRWNADGGIRRLAWNGQHRINAAWVIHRVTDCYWFNSHRVDTSRAIGSLNLTDHSGRIGFHRTNLI